MKKTKKVKRYQDEGLVTAAIEDTPEGREILKREGLAASEREPKEEGFLAGLKRFGTRLTEGNIDDPRSAAYKKYGAGRGLAERNKNIPIENRSPQPLVPPVPNEMPAKREGYVPAPSGSGSSMTDPANVGQGRTGAGSSSYTSPEGMSGIDSTIDSKPTPKPRAKPRAKPKAKAKAKSGVSYSEKEAKEDLDRETKRAQSTAPKTSELEKETAERDKKRKALLATALAATGVALGSGALRKNIKKGSRASDNMPSSMGKNPRLMGLDPMMEGDLERMAGEGGPNFKKGGKVKPKPVKKYASGGSVSSASKRADGIAKRGKTRGRMF